jgi:glutamate/tyrosine decarboxylase-like PLP-dependent enzyme
MEKKCKPEDIGLKSFFLGPQSENAIWFQSSVSQLLVRWFEWRQGRQVEDGRAISPKDQASPEFQKQRKITTDILADLSKRFEEEVPKYSPRYAGHMFSEVALPAMLGHIAALLHNPNTISGESARVGVQIENEAIEELLKMIGYSPSEGTGHFTSGGTVANFEAVVRARGRMALWMAGGAALAELNGSIPDPCRDAVVGWQAFDRVILELSQRDPAWESRLDSWNFEKTGFHHFASCLNDVFGVSIDHPVMLVPSHKHYSWQKAARLFGFGDETMKLIHLDARGRMDVGHLNARIQQAKNHDHPVMMVVSVSGTTELGVVDPIGDVASTLRQAGFIWHHVDAAYGGFLATLTKDVYPEMSDELQAGLASISASDSVTIDPHKLGYVPYSAGVFMVAQKRNYCLRSIEAPYIQYSGLDRGPMTLEGSRSGTGVAATWMVAKTMGLTPNGFGRVLARNMHARRLLEQELSKAKMPAHIVQTTDSNVLCFVMAREGEPLSVVNTRTKAMHEKLSQPDSRFIVSTTTIDWQHYGALCERFAGSWGASCDVHEIVLIRMCLMNPFFMSKETAIFYPEAFVHEIDSLAMSAG